MKTVEETLLGVVFEPRTGQWYRVFGSKDLVKGKPLWSIRHKSPMGCVGVGATYEEALAELNRTRAEYLNQLEAEGIALPAGDAWFPSLTMQGKQQAKPGTQVPQTIQQWSLADPLTARERDENTAAAC